MRIARHRTAARGRAVWAAALLVAVLGAVFPAPRAGEAGLAPPLVGPVSVGGAIVCVPTARSERLERCFSVPCGGGRWLALPPGATYEIEAVADGEFNLFVTSNAGPDEYAQWFEGANRQVPIVVKSPYARRHTLRFTGSPDQTHYLLFDDANYPDGALAPFSELEVKLTLAVR